MSKVSLYNLLQSKREMNANCTSSQARVTAYGKIYLADGPVAVGGGKLFLILIVLQDVQSIPSRFHFFLNVEHDDDGLNTFFERRTEGRPYTKQKKTKF